MLMDTMEKQYVYSKHLKNKNCCMIPLQGKMPSAKNFQKAVLVTYLYTHVIAALFTIALEEGTHQESNQG